MYYLSKHRFVTTLLVIAVLSAFVGQALAWELSANYQAGLYTPGTSKPWQPSAGNLNGDVFNDANNGLRRTTQPYASQTWNDAAMQWIKANSGRLSITFHSSSRGDTGPGDCSNRWEQKAGQLQTNQQVCSRHMPVIASIPTQMKSVFSEIRAGCRQILVIGHKLVP
jgi:hypothetical protein